MVRSTVQSAVLLIETRISANECIDAGRERVSEDARVAVDGLRAAAPRLPLVAFMIVHESVHEVSMKCP